jgi:hypothetical protein
MTRRRLPTCSRNCAVCLAGLSPLLWFSRRLHTTDLDTAVTLLIKIGNALYLRKVSLLPVSLLSL